MEGNAVGRWDRNGKRAQPKASVELNPYLAILQNCRNTLFSDIIKMCNVNYTLSHDWQVQQAEGKQKTYISTQILQFSFSEYVAKCHQHLVLLCAV